MSTCPHPIFICDVYVCAICECDKSAEMPASRLCMSAQYVLVTHHYFSFINNCTLVLHTHTQVGLIITAFLVAITVYTSYCYKTSSQKICLDHIPLETWQFSIMLQHCDVKTQYPHSFEYSSHALMHLSSLYICSDFADTSKWFIKCSQNVKQTSQAPTQEL